MATALSRPARALRRNWPLLLLAAPAVIYFIVFHYGALFGNVIAFKNYAPFIGIWASPWVGVDNFTRMFADPAGEVLDTFDYYNGVLGGDWGYGAAAGLFRGVIGALLVFAANKIAHRLGEQGVYS